MAQNKLKAYVERRRWRSDTVRDFVDHAVQDPDFPDAESLQELKSYLDRHEASDETRSAAEYIWQCYEADTSKKAG